VTTPVFVESAHFVPGKIVRVDFSSAVSVPHAYDIVIGQNILAEAGTLIRMRLGERRCVIVTDSNIAPLYRSRVEAVLVTAGHEVLTSIIIPAGEANKNSSQLQMVLDRVLEAGIDRKTIIIALGGGVVGDLAGLVASLALRGIDFVQLPTSLLAQVDSSVGGKTGIDTAHGKNTIGAFHQPRLVLADVTTLDSLPAREMRAGYAEVVKYGLISNAAFFQWCCARGAQLLGGNHEAIIYAVNASCTAKAKIVAEDERETGVRALLNFGHTFGHALESVTGFSNLLIHGEAVALGMILATRFSVGLGLCSQNDYEQIYNHFASVGLPIVPPPFSYDVDALMHCMAHDKKAENGKLTLILTRGIGQAFVSRNVDANEVRKVWQEFLK